jgi:gag-polyprotein putative aspartyl protease
MSVRSKAWGALLLLLAWSLGLGSGIASADCKLATVADLHADVSGGAPIIDGTINGKPIKILIDSGSSSTVLTGAGASRLGLARKPTSGETYAIGGAAETSVTVVKELKIDRFKLAGVNLAVVGDPRRYPGFDMLLGDDILSRYDVEFDLANGAIRLFESQGCQPAQLVYWAKPYSQATLLDSLRDAPEITANVEIDGRRTVAELDTGSPASLVDSIAAESVGVFRHSPGSEAAGPVNGLGPESEAAFTGEFSSFVFGDEKLAHTRLLVADLTSNFEFTPSGSTLARPMMGAAKMLIGDDFLHAHRVMVANREHVILFSYNGGPVFAVARRDPPTRPGP